MKKIILFLMLAISLASCEGPRGMDGIDGVDGQGVTWRRESITIKPSQWQVMGKPHELNSYFYVDVKLNSLSENIFDNGTVIGYIETSPDIKNGLPYVLHKGDEDWDGEFFWTETYDFDFYPKGARFYLTYSDFNTVTKPNEKITFHIVMMSK